LEVLGITIDAGLGVAYISDDKRARILAQLEDAERSTDVLQIHSLAGSLVFVTRVCLVGRAFLRRIFDQIRACQRNPFDRKRLSQGAKREIEWWRTTLRGYRGVRYLADDPAFMTELHVWSDASGTNGIGGHLEGASDEFSERIAVRHSAKDILFKEALAVLRCIELWGDRMPHKLIILHVDNQALVAALNQGSCRQRVTQAVIRRIYTLAAWGSFFFQARWISTRDNKRADDLSRFISATPALPSDMGLSGDDFYPDCTDDLVDDLGDPEHDDVDESMEFSFPQFG
jgi:hypothetical protein